MLFDHPQEQKENLAPVAGKNRRWLLAPIGLGLVALLCACATGTANYGKLQSSANITRLFDEAQVLPDHTYYYSGLQGVPNAIIAIHPNYALQAKAWQQINFSHSTLKKWIYRMNYVHLVTPRGAWIIGPDGDRLGIWYSAERQTAIRLDKENRLVIAAPYPPELRGVP